MSHKTVGPLQVEVIADNSGTWAGNALRFDTVDEAVAYGRDLAGRWTLVRNYRVVREEDGQVEFIYSKEA
jgi:hypothetical protein